MAVLKYKNAQGEYVALNNYSVSPITIEQTTGTNTDTVMSQNAVTTALASKADTDSVYSKTDANNIFLSQESAANTYATSTDVSSLSTTVTSIQETVNNLPSSIDDAVTSASASGASPLTLSASISDNTLTISGSIAEATSSANGYMTTTQVANLTDALSEYTYNNGVTTASSIASIPVTYKLAVCTISANGSFSLASTLSAGKELHAIVHNSSSSDITITLPNSGSYVTMDGEDTLTVDGSGYADINVVSDGTTMYIRAL